MKRKKIAVARLWHEGNSFAPIATRFAEFQRREWAKGDAVVQRYRGTATELGAVVDAIERHQDWQVEFLRIAAAPPGGPMERGLFSSIRDELIADLKAGDWDAVYLSLHGACIAEDENECDLALLRAVRAAIGDRPLAVTFDLHANLSPEVGELADILVGYKTYPHVDMAETAAKTLSLLARRLAGEIEPVVRVVKVGALLTSFKMRTQVGPMAEVEAFCARLEKETGTFDITPFGGFSYGDVPFAGASVAITFPKDKGKAEDIAQRAAEFFKERQARFAVRFPGAAEAIAEALQTKGTVAVLEPADNPLSGGAADTPELLRALLATRFEGRACFAFIADPGVVALAVAAGLGATLKVRLGGRLSSSFGAPIEIDAQVLRITNGRFVNEGPMEKALAVDIGQSVVLRHGQVEIVVTKGNQAANDPGWFQLHGIDLGALRLLCIKAKNHFRAAFGDRFQALVECDTPGPAALDLSLLPFRHLPPGLLEGWRAACAGAIR